MKRYIVITTTEQITISGKTEEQINKKIEMIKHFAIIVEIIPVIAICDI